jgi:hypothetical protein
MSYLYYLEIILKGFWDFLPWYQTKGVGSTQWAGMK